jgi:hypothetical protein
MFSSKVFQEVIGMQRVILTGVLGGVGMFLWLSIAHMVLPLGHIGFKQIPNEQAVLAPLNATIGTAPGLYFYPGMDITAERNAAMQEYERKLAINPSGLLLYHPPGRKAMDPSQLMIEFLTDVVLSLIAVLLLAQARLGSFGAKVGFVALIGVLASIVTNVPYWNWYGFPADFTAAAMVTTIVAFVVVGLIAGAMLKGK